VDSAEERRLADQLAEELRRLRVEDVIVQTLVSVSQIGYRRLGLTPETKDDRDLEQVRFSIETMQALTPVLETMLPTELVRDFASSVANLQLAYARAAAEGQAPADADG
jgi:hypothetical protein